MIEPAQKGQIMSQIILFYFDSQIWLPLAGRSLLSQVENLVSTTLGKTKSKLGEQKLDRITTNRQKSQITLFIVLS